MEGPLKPPFLPPPHLETKTLRPKTLNYTSGKRHSMAVLNYAGQTIRGQAVYNKELMGRDRGRRVREPVSGKDGSG